VSYLLITQRFATTADETSKRVQMKTNTMNALWSHSYAVVQTPTSLGWSVVLLRFSKLWNAWKVWFRRL